MVKQVVFDLGNVIIQWNPNCIVSQYSCDKNIQEMLLKEEILVGTSNGNSKESRL